MNWISIAGVSQHLQPIMYFIVVDGLAFGISSAAEVFQNQIQTALAGIPGCSNLSDDIIIFGKTQQEHAETLQNVFCRLAEKGLKLKS